MPYYTESQKLEWKNYIPVYHHLAWVSWFSAAISGLQFAWQAVVWSSWTAPPGSQHLKSRKWESIQSISPQKHTLQNQAANSHDLKYWAKEILQAFMATPSQIQPNWLSSKVVWNEYMKTQQRHEQKDLGFSFKVKLCVAMIKNQTHSSFNSFWGLFS